MKEEKIFSVWVKNIDHINHKLIEIIREKKIKIYNFSSINKYYDINKIEAKNNIVSLVKNDFIDYESSFFLKINNINNIIIIESITDAQNLGSIIRTMAAFNVNCLVIKKNNQVKINEKVYRISRGYIKQVKIYMVVNLRNFIKKLKKNDFWIYTTYLSANSKKITDTKFYKKRALIFGNESTGISKHLAKDSDFLFYVPMAKNIDSLNVNIAVAVVLGYLNFNTDFGLF